MKPGTWAKVGNNMFELDPAKNPALNPNYPNEAPWRGVGGVGNVIEAWGGAAYDRKRDKLRLKGGGHADYAGNEQYDQDLNVEAPQWALVRPPTGAIGNTGVLDDGKEATDVCFDGRPRSVHSYNNLTWAGQHFYLGGGSTYKLGWGGPHFFRYGDDWENLGAKKPGFGPILVHDEKRNRLYGCGMGSFDAIWYYDLATGAQVDTGWVKAGGGQIRLVVCPEIDVIAICGNGAGLGLYDYGRTARPWNGYNLFATVDGMPASLPAMFTGEWVPSLGPRGSVVQWNGGTGFDVFEAPATGDVTTQAWTYRRLEADPANTVDPGPPNANGVYGRFFHSPRLQLLGVVTDGTVRVFALPERAA